MSSPEQITAVAMVCDYAQIADGKLNIMGGGWQYLWAPEAPVPYSLVLAVNLSVPWARTNQDLEITTRLISEDGEAVTDGNGDEVRAGGNLRVGRPPNARAGVPIVVPFIVPFAAIPLDFGGYVFEVSAGANVVTQVSFQVANLPAT